MFRRFVIAGLVSLLIVSGLYADDAVLAPSTEEVGKALTVIMDCISASLVTECTDSPISLSCSNVQMDHETNLPRRIAYFLADPAEYVVALTPKSDTSGFFAAFFALLSNTVEDPLVSAVYLAMSTRGYHQGGYLLSGSISFTYPDGTYPVLKNVSFTVRNGERLAFVGRNGSGKSTLLRLLAGLEEWESGQMKYMAKARMQGIFLMAQTLELPPRNMLLEHLTRTKDPAISQFIESANIRKLIRKEGLSGGERSKVGLAWALSSDAYILLLDEPLAAVALDDRAPLLQAFLEAAVKRDKWIVIASHDEIPADLEKNFTTLDLGNVEL